MKFIDLFAGVGGFRLGMEANGHDCVGWCEQDKFAQKSYRAIHDTEGEWFHDDIRDVRPGELPEADCYTGGFPCQSFSVAGERGGFNDTRGTLFFEIARLAKERQPEYLFLENVRGLLSHDGGTTFGTILNTMAELGYSVEWQVLNSKHFGVPQNRERVFIIGHLGGFRGREIFPIKKTSEIKIQKQGSANSTVARCITAGGNSGGNHSGMTIIKNSNGSYRRLTPREFWTLQGFPDWAFERAQEVNSDTQLYKQAGNSVTVNVIEAISERFKETD